jgi:D-arabinose 1-dehydrogenase-like Zn-dependent alcohol dehydrogenase
MTGDLAPRDLDDIRRIVSLTDVESALDEIARGGVRGRYVVDTTG